MKWILTPKEIGPVDQEGVGGTLIQGAIIASEYGLPCITGIPYASELIETGDMITGEGYFGMVAIGVTGI